MTETNKARMNKYIASVNSALEEYISERRDEKLQKNILDAMYYSLSAGGKRIRPVLLMEFCRVCGGNTDEALIPACALEMIHTFSLIHDDLPCMDDDDFRRGKPSCHKQFGESIALLAGDELENFAFNVLSTNDKLSSDVKVKLICELSNQISTRGMIGGQVIDIEQTAKDEETLLSMYSKKTSALLKAACKMGCITAQADKKLVDSADIYAEKLGLAFQIVDDILDVTSTTEELGKPVGSDKEQNKLTYVTMNGLEKSEEKAEQLTNEALEILDNFNDNEFLKELTSSLLKRRK